ncbi:MAG TPA: globin-coupled sensor protein [Anoxybacillus sp.]|nr:globin-coupled sensor protein [Anoxybacillus sp.]
MNFTFFWKKRENSNAGVAEVLNSPASPVRLQDAVMEKQLEMIELTKRDLAMLTELKPFIEEKIDFIVTRFYDTLQKEPSLLEIINRHSSVDRLKQTLKIHIIEMFSGKIDEEFIEKRTRIAVTHLRIGLLPKWYMCAFQQLLLSIWEVISPHIHDPHMLTEAMKSVTKILSFEQQLVLEQYEKTNEETRLQIERLKNELKEQLKATAQELSSVSSEVSSSVSELTDQAKEILNFAEEASSIADLSERQSVEGQQKLQNQLSTINSIEAMMAKIQAEMQSLQQSANKIENINSLVTAIADQTNMLSLNASIEAARAGEHGKGFAVVANEVRNLASQTKQSVSGVTEILNEINKKMNIISESLQSMVTLVSEGTDDMEKINQFFNTFVASLKQIQEQNRRIDHEMKQYVHVVTEINDAVSNVATSAEQLERMTYQL